MPISLCRAGAATDGVSDTDFDANTDCDVDSEVLVGSREDGGGPLGKGGRILSPPGTFGCTNGGGLDGNGGFDDGVGGCGFLCGGGAPAGAGGCGFMLVTPRGSGPRGSDPGRLRIGAAAIDGGLAFGCGGRNTAPGPDCPKIPVRHSGGGSFGLSSTSSFSLGLSVHAALL